MLEKANTTEQALNLLMQLPIASNYNILIADKRGKMVVVECTPNIKKIGEAKSVDDGYLVCTVNSFISDKLKPYDLLREMIIIPIQDILLLWIIALTM